MKELKITQLSKTYGTKVLLEQIDWAIRTGQRVGLIGPNGTGKSSFLKVLAGIDNYDTGEITKPNDYTIAYLDQNPQLEPTKTILETVYDSQAKDIQLLLQYEQLRTQLEADPTNNTLLTRFTKMSDEMTLHNVWDVEVRAKSILSQLGLVDLTRIVGECSGGEQKRIGIAQVLIEQPDLLILDEPTNHLDVKSVQWLEKYLANYQGALLLVTHDRYFLERSVNHIVELRFGKLTAYEGNYETYLTKRAEQAEIQQRTQEKQDKLFQQELAWMRKGAKARTTKQQARIDRFHDLKSTIASRNQEVDGIEFNFQQQRIGNRIIDMENVSVSINNQSVIRDFTKNFVKGERIGIIGENGVGKTTFLNTIAGMHSIDSGTYEMGQTVRLAYYRQLDQDLPGDVRVLAYLTKIADNFKREDGSLVSASQLLEQFNFPRNTHGSEIRTLSGGERRRLYLLSLLIQQPNVLLLDEPTNDLDIDTLTVLEDYLATFEGVVVVVSHDRYFLDKTVDQLLDIQGQGAYTVSWGNYSDYLERAESQPVEKAKPVVEKSAEPEKVSVPAKKLSYHEKKEWAELPNKITKLEVRLEEIQAEMNKPSSDAGKLMDLQRELEEKEEALMALYERQEELAERA
ncbi:ABC-F family ATP-binding cassette domain-containing protein [Tuanshanicoccus yangjingiae]|uniref:ribosomal protection-like ABC-F family protein n=1 Tax=Aerococcaceae bacterium zg-252 TaxID=2796928 RepID=UPI0013B77993|nr:MULTISPECIES: ABC-F family ATP-binding cassette domain-containing protein [unclassified Facklamia]NEW65367.1 ATP-binding cassette domain-containing protein [Facklamia sp. 252]NEW68519.1 ATP-binding cassette domain-containing protein [Facklamia sp. 253]QQD64893.1 ABC-F family ATP-binding cassette domain-containing protein [Aerococcaceae bacterium zg-252]